MLHLMVLYIVCKKKMCKSTTFVRNVIKIVKDLSIYIKLHSFCVCAVKYLLAVIGQ